MKGTNKCPSLRLVVQIALVFAAATTICACNFSDVRPQSENFNKRIYAGGGLLISRLEPDTSDAEGVSVKESASGGGGLYLGYDLSSRFAVEGHIADLGKSTLAPEGSISYQVAGLSGIVYALQNPDGRLNREGFSVFGRLGLGALKNDAKDVRYRRVNDVHVIAGLGVEYGFNNALAVRAEFLAHETDAKYVQAALLYRFGSASSTQSNSATESDGFSEVDKTPVAVVVTPDPEVEVSETFVVDEDADGVADSLDKCQGTTSGLPVDARGCEVFDGANEGIVFLSGSAQLTEGSLVVLTEFAETLKSYPEIKIAIHAHTDNVGDARENLQLSRRRALAVVGFLRDQNIAGRRLAPRAFGDSRPVQSNATAQGRAANRRVEFSVVR